VDAQQLGALLRALERERDRSGQSSIDGRLVGERPDRALAARAEHDRATKAVEHREAVHDREIVLDVLAEAEAGVDDDLRPIDAGRDRRGDPRLQPVVNLEQNGAIVARVVLHRRRIALVMHQHDRAARRRDDLDRARIPGQRRHVVDEARASGQRRLHHLRLSGVDRDGGAAAGEPTHDRFDPGDLVALPERLRAGAGRFAADVDQRRARRGHRIAGLDRRLDIVAPAVAGEAVRRHVQDAGDLRLIEPDHPLAEPERRARRREVRPGVPRTLTQRIQPRLETFDRHKLHAVVADDLDSREPQQPTGQPRDLAVMPERRIDEAGGTKMDPIAHKPLLPLPPRSGNSSSSRLRAFA